MLQWDEETNAWGIAFLYPDMAGDHMDGMEVVTDPNTGIALRLRLRHDQRLHRPVPSRRRAGLGAGEPVPATSTPAGALVEGFGFGPLNHFWATGGNSVYELGGGDLGQYTEPVPTG